VNEERNDSQVSQPACEPTCRGCGKKVKEATQQDARRFRHNFPENSRPVRMFECINCESIIYEDEFTLGEFVPPQFRETVESLLSTVSEAPDHLDLLGWPTAVWENEVN